MKKLNSSQIGNYVIHGMLIAQLFALIFIQLQKAKFVCKATESNTVFCVER